MQTSSVDRRTMLRTSVAAVAATAVGSVPAVLRAADPPKRIGRPHMKLSLAAYSLRNYMAQNWPSSSGKTGAMTIQDFINYCAEQDLDGTELTSYYFPVLVKDQLLNEIKEQTFRLGLDISGTAIGNDFCLPLGHARDKSLMMTRQWIDYAAKMGAPVIRIFAGSTPAGDKEEAALERCIHGINESVSYAATRGVILALENHGGITSTPEQMLAIVRGVKSSPYFGVNFDSGNFRSADPYADLEKIAPWTVNAQIKVSIDRAGKRERSDFKRVIKILRDAGYKGYVVLEYEEPEEPKAAIPGLLKELRELIA